MSSEEPQAGGWPRGWALAAGAAVIGLVAASVLLVGGGGGPARPTGSGGTAAPSEAPHEDTLAGARAALLKSGDAATCASALQQINAHLAQKSAPNPALDPRVKELVEPDAAELAELESATYTPLDGRYLEECLLLRDAARALGVTGDAAGRKVAPLDRAAAAFAWVTRQVRVAGTNEQAVPPAYVLRRGEGSPTERALVFLALLPQLNAPGDDANALHGCLVLLPNEGSESAELWACGVTVGGGTDLYLFDPRAGIPLPGPGGKGVATLGDAAREPAVLAQLDAPGGPAYDIKAEKARGAQVWCVPPLSALAPRMHNLEKLLGPGLPVRLGTDLPGDVDRLIRAARAAVPKAKVIVWKAGARLLRQFLPPEAGGPPAPKSARESLAPQQAFEFSLVSWQAMPRELQQLPRNHEIGQRIFGGFARPFQEAVLKPGGARDLMLRGRYAPAVEELLSDQSALRGQQQTRATYPDLGKKVDEWFNNTAVKAFAQLQRAQRSGDPAAVEEAKAQVEQAWKGAAPVVVLMQGAVADVRLPQVTFLAALCLHEKAVQAQLRLDQAGGDAREAEREKIRDAWGEARSWWERYQGEYPEGAGTAAARRLRGEAEAALGNWKAAADAWDEAAAKTPLVPEKVADLYRARRARAEHGDVKK
jgi:hypothetical protein